MLGYMLKDDDLTFFANGVRDEIIDFLKKKGDLTEEKAKDYKEKYLCIYKSPNVLSMFWRNLILRQPKSVDRGIVMMIVKVEASKFFTSNEKDIKGETNE